MASVTLTQSKCDFTVTVKIEFDNQTNRADDKQFRNLITRRMDQAQAIWNGAKGSRKFGCCTVKFKFDWKVAGPTVDLDYVHVIVLPGAGQNDERSWTARDGSIGEAYDTDSAPAFAHEMGHVLGLTDEYDEKTGKTKVKEPGSTQGVMGQIDGVVAILQRHIDTVMARLGAQCPEECCKKH